MTRPVQYFSPEYLQACQAMSPKQICQFLDDFRQLELSATRPVERKLISLRVPLPLLRAFRAKADRSGAKYQTQIQELMRRWVESG